MEEPTAEQIAAVVGLDAKDYEQAYIRYVETDFGADDVYIVLPKEGKDEEGVSHRENILSQLRERKDFRTREFATMTFTIRRPSQKMRSSLSAAVMW